MRRTEENIYKDRNTKKEAQSLKGRKINCFKKSIQKKQTVLYAEILNDWLAEKRLNVKTSTYKKYMYEAEARLIPRPWKYPDFRIDIDPYRGIYVQFAKRRKRTCAENLIGYTCYN